MLGNPTRHCAVRFNKSCFFFLRASSLVTEWNLSYFQPCCREEKRKKRRKKRVEDTHRQTRTEYPPRSGSASSLALSCFLRCRFTFIKNCCCFFKKKKAHKEQRCCLRTAWSYCGKDYNRDKSTCSLFRLHASVYLLGSLSTCLSVSLSVCVHTALFQVSSRGRAERSAAASCLLFFLRTGGASFRTNGGHTTDSRNPPPPEKSPLSL